MFSKIYLSLLGVSFLIMGILIYLCFSWLQSIGDPASVVENYTFYSGVSWNALWILFIILIGFANAVLWKGRRGWALWTSLAFFVFFIVAQTFWLENEFYTYQKTHDMTESSVFLKPFLGVMIITIAAVGVFFDQFIVMRMRDKMPGKSEDPKDQGDVESDSPPVTE